MGIQDYEEALTYFNKALAQNPRQVEFLINRSQCFFYLKQTDKSISDLEAALECEKEDNP